MGFRTSYDLSTLPSSTPSNCDLPSHPVSVAPLAMRSPIVNSEPHPALPVMIQRASPKSDACADSTRGASGVSALLVGCSSSMPAIESARRSCCTGGGAGGCRSTAESSSGRPSNGEARERRPDRLDSRHWRRGYVADSGAPQLFEVDRPTSSKTRPRCRLRNVKGRSGSSWGWMSRADALKGSGRYPAQPVGAEQEAARVLRVPGIPGRGASVERAPRSSPSRLGPTVRAWG